MKVLKFGGTSVGKPERMQMVSDIITQGDGQKIVVLSAVSGTTNSLVQIGETLYQNNKVEAIAQIDKLYAQYEEFLKILYKKDEFLIKGKEAVDKQFTVIRGMVQNPFTDLEERLLLAQGELMSTQMFSLFLSENGTKNTLLWSLDFMSVDEDHEPDLPSISAKLNKIVNENPDGGIFIAQGYICLNAVGEVDNLKRGGSDYTASLIGAATKADDIQIWTDIDGMHNNDPRIVKNTAAIPQISFDEAAELAYFGAKILHPATIRPAMEANIPVKLLNTMQPEAKGTVISKATGKRDIKAVAAKDFIIAIKIKSTRMLLAYGFLRKVFEVFEKYKTPIDMITTSEIAVSLTIDDNSNLKQIVSELEAFGLVEVDREQTIICIAGENIPDQPDAASRVFSSLSGIPIRMVSFGGSRFNISVLVAMADKQKALQALNDGLFLKK
jgi:aspartate kinase